MQHPHDATVPPHPEPQDETKPTAGVSANRLGRKMRTLAELMSAAMCRGDVEAGQRYWNEYLAIVTVGASYVRD